MKNLIKMVLTIVGTLLFTNVIIGQTVGQGAWMLGGTAGFRSVSPKSDSDLITSNTTIEFSPNVGYFIADDLAIGLSLTLRSESNPDFLDATDDSSTDFGLGPFVR